MSKEPKTETEIEFKKSIQNKSMSIIAVLIYTCFLFAFYIGLTFLILGLMDFGFLPNLFDYFFYEKVERAYGEKIKVSFFNEYSEYRVSMPLSGEIIVPQGCDSACISYTVGKEEYLFYSDGDSKSINPGKGGTVKFPIARDLTLAKTVNEVVFAEIELMKGGTLDVYPYINKLRGPLGLDFPVGFTINDLQRIVGGAKIKKLTLVSSDMEEVVYNGTDKIFI